MIAVALETANSDNTDERQTAMRPGGIKTSNYSSRTDADITVLNRSTTGTGRCGTNRREIREFVQQNGKSRAEL